MVPVYIYIIHHVMIYSIFPFFRTYSNNTHIYIRAPHLCWLVYNPPVMFDTTPLATLDIGVIKHQLNVLWI